MSLETNKYHQRQMITSYLLIYPRYWIILDCYVQKQAYDKNGWYQGFASKMKKTINLEAYWCRLPKERNVIKIKFVSILVIGRHISSVAD